MLSALPRFAQWQNRPLAQRCLVLICELTPVALHLPRCAVTLIAPVPGGTEDSGVTQSCAANTPPSPCPFHTWTPSPVNLNVASPLPTGATDLRASPCGHRGAVQRRPAAPRDGVLEGGDSGGGVSGERAACLSCQCRIAVCSCAGSGVLLSSPGGYKPLEKERGRDPGVHLSTSAFLWALRIHTARSSRYSQGADLQGAGAGAGAVPH